MKSLPFIIIFLSIVYLTLLQCSDPKGSSSNDLAITENTHYMPFPDGYGYPKDQDTLNKWISANDKSKLREHAWGLWAGLNVSNSSGRKVWQSWHNLNQIFDGLNGRRPNEDTTTTDESLSDNYGLAPFYPPNYDCGINKEGIFINTVDALLLFTIFYNQATFDWITHKDLNKELTLESFLNKKETDIPPAPKEAMLLKQIYYPVKAGKLKYTALPIWDGPGNRDPLKYNGFETWERAVAITTEDNPLESVPVEYLYNLSNRDSFNYKFDQATTVSVDDFYHIKLDAKTLKTFSRGDSCIVNLAFNYVHNQDFEKGDYLVTIAMHILSKEIEDWTMQTVWWHDKPEKGQYAMDRPSDIPDGKWKNYLLTQAYYMAVPNEPTGEPHIAYNPYIELMVPEKNRMQSNCQNCHKRAGYPVMPSIFVNPIGFPTQYEAGANYNPMQEGFIADSDTIFKNVLRTDFNWAIPMNSN